ncbi:MAG: phosphopantetheine-binding protein [Planctomycetota bacterium]|jgi:hypothetical protein
MTIVRYTICLITFVSFSFNGISGAAPLEEYEKALKVIEDFAKKMCDEIPLEAKSENVELSGKAKAGLSGLLRRLTSLGIEVAGSYQQTEYQGVLQTDLAGILKDSRDCKREIFRELKSIFFEQHDVPPDKNSALQPAKDPTVLRIRGILAKQMGLAAERLATDVRLTTIGVDPLDFWEFVLTVGEELNVSIEFPYVSGPIDLDGPEMLKILDRESIRTIAAQVDRKRP